jgi:hypothetical protein
VWSLPLNSKGQLDELNNVRPVIGKEVGAIQKYASIDGETQIAYAISKHSARDGFLVTNCLSGKSVETARSPLRTDHEGQLDELIKMCAERWQALYTNMPQ